MNSTSADRLLINTEIVLLCQFCAIHQIKWVLSSFCSYELLSLTLIGYLGIPLLILTLFSDTELVFFLPYHSSGKDKATYSAPNLHGTSAEMHTAQHYAAGCTFYLKLMCCHVTCLIIVKSVTAIGRECWVISLEVKAASIIAESIIRSDGSRLGRIFSSFGSAGPISRQIKYQSGDSANRTTEHPAPDSTWQTSSSTLLQSYRWQRCN